MAKEQSSNTSKSIYTQDSHSITQEFPLILTKLNPPRSNTHLVNRSQLQSKVIDTKGWTLALVCAGAGFGKTTLLTQWYNLIKQTGYCAAWLSLDIEDNQLNSFYRYLASSLSQDLKTECLHHLNEVIRNTESTEKLTAALINILYQYPKPVYFFIDDFHTISDPQIYQLINFLLEKSPSHIHWIIGSRASPSDLSLGRLRIHKQLIELGAPELRFNLTEACLYFEKTAELSLDKSQTQLLLNATEGWVAGIQMLTLIPAIKKNPEQAIKCLADGIKTIDHYWQDVIFDSLPKDIEAFLVSTSILSRLNADLCNAVTGLNTAPATLEWIERHNLFIAALDSQGQWFRYHQLFSEALQLRLQKRTDINSIELHERASQWFAQQSLWAEAVRHALSAGRLSNNSDPLLAESGAQSLAEQGDIDTLLLWLQKLPITDNEHRIDLQLNMAWALAHRFRFDESRVLLNELTNWIGVTHLASKELLVIRTQVIQAICEAFAERIDKALAYVQPLLPKIPTGHIWVDGLICNILSFCYLLRGDLHQVQSVQCYMPTPKSPTENFFVTVYRNFILGLSYIKQGHINTAEQYLLDSLDSVEQLTGTYSTGSATLASLLAELAYERGCWDQLEHLLIQRREQIDNFVPLDGVLSAYRALFRKALAQSEDSQALVLLQHARQIAVQRSWERLQAALLLEQIIMYTQRDNLVMAEQLLWQMELLPNNEQNIPNCRHYAKIAHTYLLMARNLYDMGNDCITELIREFEHHSCALEVARLKPLKAILLWKKGQNTESQETLMSALEFGCREGLLHSILDYGAILIPILNKCLEQIKENKKLFLYVDNIIKKLMGSTEAVTNDHYSLSDRELQTLTLLASGLSNKEMARYLDISTETVKWHLKNLYMKLEVASRTQAISKALSLKLVNQNANFRNLSHQTS